jgi:serine/threonine-protein kinase
MSIEKIIRLSPGAPGGGSGASRPPRLPELIGHIGRYRRLEKIGEGGMGEVFRGTDADGKSVILKFIAIDQFLNHMDAHDLIAFVLRFLNEYELGNMIRHPNIARVIDTNIRVAIPGVDNLKNIFRQDPRTGRLLASKRIRDNALASFDRTKIARQDIFIVTEFVPFDEGGTTAALNIAQTFKGQSVGTEVVKMFLLPVFEALAMAHEKGVAHRDLKPDNLLVTADKKGDPIVKIIDLGIAREFGKKGGTILTKFDKLLGTPDHMPPADYSEEAQLDQAAFKIFDIYSMGTVIYELMTGKNPFEGQRNPYAILHAKTNLSFFDFSGIDPKARPIVKKMMSPMLRNNFSSMLEVSDAWRSI